MKYRKDGYVCFTLSNKPQYECFLDEEDYQIVEYNTCWYLHMHVRSGTFHIRRSLHIGDNKYETECLHEFLLKLPIDVEFTQVRHINVNGLDNRKNNLILKSLV